MEQEKYEHEQVSGGHNISDEIVYDSKTVRSMMTKRTVIAVIAGATSVFLIMSLIFSYIAITYMDIRPANRSAIYFSEDEESIKAAEKLNSMLNIVRRSFFDELTDAQILNALARGFPSALENPYTYYMDRETYEITRASMSGNYVGIGCTVSLTEQGWTQVVEVYPDSPAEEAGILPRDIFVSVDGIDVKVTNDTAATAALVRGEEGTTVEIEIFRQSTGETILMEIERRLIQQINVNYEMIEDRIGYIHVKSFSEGVDRDFVSAMEHLKSEGAEHIIFDLRFNSGGGAHIMTGMLEYLLPEDYVLATIRGRDSGERFEIDWVTEQPMQVPEEMRYVIITNEYSASASEFFSGSLRDHGKALIVGEQTFGKGSGTSLFELSDGSAMNVTVFKYYLPGGEIVEGNGITPDIFSSLPEELRYRSIELITAEEDTVLQDAIKEIRRFLP